MQLKNCHIIHVLADCRAIILGPKKPTARLSTVPSQNQYNNIQPIPKKIQIGFADDSTVSMLSSPSTNRIYPIIKITDKIIMAPFMILDFLLISILLLTIDGILVCLCNIPAIYLSYLPMYPFFCFRFSAITSNDNIFVTCLFFVEGSCRLPVWSDMAFGISS